MCDAISLSIRHLPTLYQKHPDIQARLLGRGGEEEVQFFYDRKPYPPLLPILLEDQFRIVRWGNRQRRSKMLPHTGRVEMRELQQGCWQHASIQEVLILNNSHPTRKCSDFPWDDGIDRRLDEAVLIGV